MADIQNIVIENYTQNLHLLKQIDQNLLKRVTLLSEAINTGLYNERYQLEYINEEQEFDIYDTVEKTFLYNKQANKFNSNAKRNTNFDKTNTINLFDNQYYNRESYVEPNEDSAEENIKIKVANDLYQYKKIFNTSTIEPTKKFKSIPKFIFFGTLLGTHIPIIHKKLNSDIYFICESNLEIFRLSLFTTNYLSIAQSSRIIFSIMDDKEEFLKKFELWILEDFKHNYMIKYYSSNYNIDDYFERLITLTSQIEPFNYTYHNILDILLERSIKNINNYLTLNTTEEYTFLNNVPVLLLAAGPSLMKNISWIKVHKDNYFIVAIAATITILYEHNILPDLIISTDSGKEAEMQLPEKVMIKIKNIPFLTSHITHKKMLNKFNKNNIIIYEVMTKIKDTSALLKGASVSEISVQLLSILGANNIYMIGVDLALNQDTGESHFSNYQWNNKINISDKNTPNSFMKDGHYSNTNTTTLVKGNFVDTVTTTLILNHSIIEFNKLFNNFIYSKPNLKVYNLSDGAYINHTIPLNISNINISTTLKKPNILKFLLESSTNTFTNREKIKALKSLELINIIINEIKNIQSIKVKSYEDFLNQRNKLFQYLMDDSKNFKDLYLNRLFQNYILITERYFCYNFNESIRNEVNILKKVKKEWINQITYICQQYKNIIQNM